MSITLLAWLATFVILAGLSLRRPAYGVSLYLFTYFVNPSFWWWGDLIEAYRWNLSAAAILLVAVLVQAGRSEPGAQGDRNPAGLLAVLMSVNALAVHIALAPEPAVSETLLILLFKFTAFYFLMIAAIRNRADLRLVLWSIVLCASYIGYEVMVNDRGNFTGGRLEGVGAAGVQNSNELASLMLAVLPIGGYLFLTGKPREKIVAALTTPLSMNVLLLCNSRGAFLGLIAAGVIIAAMSPSVVRLRIIRGLALGGVALLLLLGDPQIFERFMTTFTGGEERDGATTTRLVIWSAALNQIRDHPFGAGGESFSAVYGQRYLPEVGYDSDGRAVHNGFLNEICNWGFQGLFLRLAFFFAAFQAARRAGKRAVATGAHGDAVLSACLISGIAGFFATAMFGDYLDDEWGVWLAALAVAYGRIEPEAAASLAAQPEKAGLTGLHAAREAAS